MQTEQTRLTAALAGALIMTLLAGCQSTPSRVEDNFGSSVRNAIAQQTAPEAQTGYGLDGEKAEVILDAYRTDVAEPEEVERDLIQIRLGN